MNGVSYETVFCPKLVPEVEDKSFPYVATLAKISRPFIDTTCQAVLTAYIPGYGMYRMADLVFKIVGAYRKSAVCLVGTCARSFLPRKYIISAIGEKIGLKIPVTILLSGGVSTLVPQIVWVTITSSILPQKCIEAVEQVLSNTFQLSEVKDSEITDDYVWVDVEEDRDDYVVVDTAS
ncbi:MAG: hypothetical protein FJZ59_01980 [Chlamydiae bacterium]|nr:hypothetical protein [Chlamydiota bacterium]